MSILRKLKEIFRNNSIFRNYTWVFFGQNLSSIFQIISTVIILSAIGNEGNGTLVLVQSYCYLCADLLDAQTFNSVVKFMSESLNKNRYDKAAEYIQAGFIIDFSLGVFGTLAGIFLMDLVFRLMGWDISIRQYLYLYIPAIIFRNSANGTAVGVLRQTEKFNVVILITLVISVLRVIIYTNLKILNLEVKSYIIAEAIFEVLTGISLIYFSFKALREINVKINFRHRIHNLNEFLKFNSYNTVIHSFDLILGNASNLIVAKYLGVDMLSIIKISEKISNIFIKFTTPFAQVIYPHMCMEISKDNDTAVRSLVLKFISIISVVGALLIFLLNISYDLWSPYFFESIDFRLELTLYLIFTLFTCVGAIIQPLVLALGIIRLNMWNTIIINSIYLALLFPVLQKYTLIGFIIIKASQALVMTMVKYIQSMNKMKKRKVLRGELL